MRAGRRLFLAEAKKRIDYLLPISHGPVWLIPRERSAEIAYAFDAISWVVKGKTSAADLAMAKTTSGYWAAFVRTGDPNGDGRPMAALRSSCAQRAGLHEHGRDVRRRSAEGAAGSLGVGMGAARMPIGPVWPGPGRPNVCFWHFCDIQAARFNVRSGTFNAWCVYQPNSMASTLWICATTAAPSPTAAATRLVEPARTSPMAKTPGRLVSSGRTGR